ncbi:MULTISPECIES: hypothetical protein [unclassified Janthinobacterium]|uniref:hypothetical protein n=1 Tax=unclassified Janthinobacterium TaxID=2610881 RepID=UPI0008F539D1|nr:MULTISPECIES: hypothetical protein [unclassified Janthinobacterium]APA70442.1 hypothetical protein YQ44_24590 [Janthinobacterium sp. 1_2014MBL_MicDiv]MDN2711044.1 hypothetical protein [Janthinobacterium sp. SUN118]
MAASKLIPITLLAALLPACRSMPPYAGPHGPGTPAIIEAYQSPLSFCGLLTPGVCHADILLIDKSKLASEAPEIALDGGQHRLVVRCLSNTTLATGGNETSIHMFRMHFQPGARYRFDAKVIDNRCQLAIADKASGTRSEALETY